MRAAMPRLRILMVSAHYPPVLNGYAIQCADTSNLLAARGHDVRVLTSAAPPVPDDRGARRLGRLRTAQPEGRVSLHPTFLARQFRRRGIYQSNYRACVAVAKSFRPQIAVMWQFDSIGIGLVHALQRQDIPVAFNVADSSLCTVMSMLGRGPASVTGRVRRWMYDVNVRELDLSHLMLVSAALRAVYLAEGFPGDDMTVVHNGLASGRIAAAPPPPGPGNRLLFVGRLHTSKGLTLAIEALALVNRGRAIALTLDVVGAGEPDYVAQITALAASLGLARHVRFLGQKSRSEIFGLYRHYDALVFPSIVIEGFGLTVIEAMAQGVPVVALDRGGPRDIISDRRDGVLVRGEDPQAFADGIAVLANSAAIRGQMAEAAIRKVADLFTLERHGDRTEAVLHDVIARSRHGGRAAGERRAS
jgi:glycosyltransferase involved in cell wall biosynthesis